MEEFVKYHPEVCKECLAHLIPERHMVAYRWCQNATGRDEKYVYHKDMECANIQGKCKPTDKSGLLI